MWARVQRGLTFLPSAGARHAAWPSISAERTRILRRMGRVRADQDGEPFFTSTPTAKRDARTRELVDAERLVAETHRSGVRAKSAEVDVAPSFDISNAVTKVQRAVELDAFL